jgi:hypothetical protein
VNEERRREEGAEHAIVYHQSAADDNLHSETHQLLIDPRADLVDMPLEGVLSSLPLEVAAGFID